MADNPKVLGTLGHVIKGAAVKVFNTPVTVRMKYPSKKPEGSVTLEYDGPAPTDDQKTQLQKLAQDLVNESREICVETLPRSSAEDKYKGNPVNGQYIYDKFLPPDEVAELTIVKIEDWVVNSYRSPVCSNTKEIGFVLVKSVKHRPQKSELEIVFEARKEPVDGAGGSGGGEGGKDKKGKNKGAEKVASPSAVAQPVVTKALDVYADDLVALVLRSMSVCGNDAADAQKHAIPRVLEVLNRIRNESYSAGYTARI